MDDGFDGKVALVSGGARGIGAATARLLVDRGARVMLGDLREELGQSVARELADAARFSVLDVTDEASWQTIVGDTVSHFGRLDILVNNAGILELGSVDETSLESYERVIRVNQIGAFLGIKSVVPAMREAGGGAIVNTASAAGLRGNAGLFAYTASKWACRGMSMTAALELAKYRIRVNAVLPGSIDTDIIAHLASPARDAFYATLPVPRQGHAEEIAELICFLASERSSYCSGGEFVADGGLSIAMRSAPITN
jgi:3alpha(or 20beta)-hydroxysteroid dehydrogenase